MVNKTDIYYFCDEDRIENVNNYYYVPFSGQSFLDEWRAKRNLTKKRLKSNEHPDLKDIFKTKYITEKNIINTKDLLSRIYNILKDDDKYVEALQDMKKLLQKFEVSKHVYDIYTAAYKPEKNATFKKVDLYIEFAYLLHLAYIKTYKLYYLNAFLKIIDTICSLVDSLPEEHHGFLDMLLDLEDESMQTLACNNNIELF